MKLHQLKMKAQLVQFSAVVVIALVLIPTCNGQQQQPDGQGGTTLVVSQDPNGNGINVVDRATNQQLVNTNQLEVNGNDQEELVVAGLLEWLKKKKREKDEKKNQNKLPIILPMPLPQPQPMPMPLPMPLPHPHQRKEIHIHINNHVKKDSHKKKHHQHHKHGYDFEDYHHGHDDHDYHDKHYYGKSSFPLLSHHISFDHYDQGWHGGVHGGHSEHDYSGYESQQKPQYLDSKQQKQPSNGRKSRQ